MIHCPICNKRSQVVDSRITGNTVRRRRRCLNLQCLYKWTTFEVASPVIGFLRETASLLDNLKIAAEDYGVEDLEQLPKAKSCQTKH